MPDPDTVGHCDMWKRAPDDVCGYHTGILGRAGGTELKPSLVLPMLAAIVLATATTACSTFQGTAREAPPPIVKPYNAAGTAPPERMEQFYNPKIGNMVYRFCVGSECPEPTPKKPIVPMVIVTEIDGAGTVTPIDQKISPSLADADAAHPKPDKKVVDGWKPQPQTAQTNKAAAVVAAQLEQQRRAVLEASGAARSPREAPAPPKVSVKTMGDGSSYGAKPAAPTPAPVLKGGGSLQDMVPTTGTRAPDKPQAKADVLQTPALAKAPAADGLAPQAAIKC